MGEQVTKSELHELTIQIRELIVRFDHSLEHEKEARKDIEDHEKRLRALELQAAEHKPFFETQKTIKRWIIIAILGLIGSSFAQVWTVLSKIG